MKKILPILCVILCATACIYPYTPDLEEAPEGILTVDGDISIGDMSTVRLGALMSLWWNGLSYAPDFSTARVWVEDDSGRKFPGVPETGSSFSYDIGIPRYNQVFKISTKDAPLDRSYRLCVEAFDGLYVSDWSKPAPAPVIRSIDFFCGEGDENVTVAVSVDGGDEGTGYFQLSFEELWQFHADYSISYIFNPETLAITPGIQPDFDRYWCWRTSNSGRIYPVDYTGMVESGVTAWPLQRFSRYDNRNHRQYFIRVKAKTLTKDNFRFLQALEENTNGGDNLFTPNPGEIPSNLRCESDPDRTVLGYVTVGQVSVQTASLDSRYLRTRHPDYYSLYYALPKDYLFLYEQGWLPLVENTKPDRDPEWEGDYGWGAPRCYDCVAAGGTLTIPDFWDE